MRVLKSALALILLSLIAGCAQTRILTIVTEPPDATIKVDGAYHGQGQVTVPLTFSSADEVHVITASRLGFKDEPVQVTRQNISDPLRIKLDPLTRKVTFNIVPIPARVFVDGKPITDRPTQSVSKELEFSVDEKNNWLTHTVRIEHEGFAPLEREVAWADPQATYTLRLEPQHKSLDITSEPSGATVILEGQEVGKTPLHIDKRPFPIDLASGETIPQTLTIAKAGFDPIDRRIAWDEGETKYHVDLVAKTKSIRISTNPPGATVTMDGRELERDEKGASLASNLQFEPVDEEGNLRKYPAVVSKAPADDMEWEPKRIEIGWDSGKADYQVNLKEVLTRKVPLISVRMERGSDGWTVRPDASYTLAMKSTAERADQPEPARISDAGGIIDSFAVSPDGSRIIFATLEGNDAATFRSQLVVIDSTGEGAPQRYSDGKSLDIMPTYTAAGDQIFFSSNRAGTRLSIWSMDANGAPAFTQHTTGNSFDLWPDVDADPKPRLYYQSYVETRDDPRLYSTQLHTVVVTDLTHIGGMQPRVSPTFDKVLFTRVNDKTGKRDIHIMASTGGPAINLTDTPDIDEYAPSWSRDGSRVAFASEQATDSEKRRNYDIWTMDVNQPQQQTQITTNGSMDDNPVWDPNGGGIYFRSNRGGAWAIWRIDVPE